MPTRKKDPCNSDLTDTSPEFAELYFRRWMERSPQERNLFAAKMTEASRAVVKASIQDWQSPSGLAELYRRLYGEELPADFLSAKKYQS